MTPTIAAQARNLAKQGYSADEVRSTLSVLGRPFGVAQAIARLRSEGLLAPRQKLRPNYFALRVHPAVAARIEAAAIAEGVTPSKMAHALLRQASRNLPSPTAARP